MRIVDSNVIGKLTRTNKTVKAGRVPSRWSSHNPPPTAMARTPKLARATHTIVWDIRRQISDPLVRHLALLSLDPKLVI
jgi:hypothetical protein